MKRQSHISIKWDPSNSEYMVKHYKTHCKVNFLQNAGAFEMCTSHDREHRYPGVETLMGPFGVLWHFRGSHNASCLYDDAVLFHTLPTLFKKYFS